MSVTPEALSRGNEDEQDAYSSAWIMYALTRGTTYQELQTEGSGISSADDFLIEYRARDALADAWQLARESEDAELDDYLDKLVEISAAGFLDKYVILTFAKPGWTVPFEYISELDPNGFSDWRIANGDRLDHPTFAIAEPRGADLPDPAALHPQTMACTDSIPVFQDVLADWHFQAELLDGKPVSSRDLQGFLAQALFIAASDDSLQQAITWVSNRPADLAFLAGYCSVEIMDWELAKSMKS